MTDPLRRFSPWFYAAAAYNLTWGATNVLAPSLLARPLGLGPHGLVAWQGVGMLVLVYAPGYWWAARRPSQHVHLIAIALLGKTLGPIGFAWAAATGKLPLHFGLTILTNDLIWLPAFACYLHAATRRDGGLTALLSGAGSSPSKLRARRGAGQARSAAATNGPSRAEGLPGRGGHHEGSPSPDSQGRNHRVVPEAMQLVVVT